MWAAVLILGGALAEIPDVAAPILRVPVVGHLDRLAALRKTQQLPGLIGQ
jgi:hypothetical protein